MTSELHLSRRERQIMDVVFARGEATVRQIQAELPDPPTGMAVRRLLHILEEKGHLSRLMEGREVVYLPKVPKELAGTSALQHVLDTFFGGALDEALAAHFASRETIGDEQLKRIRALIKQARKEGR